MLQAVPDRRMGLSIVDLQGEQKARQIETSTDDDMVWVDWVSDDWLIFSVFKPESRSNRPTTLGLMALKRDGSQSRMLVQREWRFKERMVGAKTLDPNPVHAMRLSPAYVDEQGLVVKTWSKTGSQLCRFDLAKGRPEDQPMLDIRDFDSALIPVRRAGDDRVDGVHIEVDSSTTVWFNESMQRIQVEVDAQLPGRVNWLSCQPCDKPGVVLVTSLADRLPGEYILYRPGQGTMQLVGTARPDVDPARMAPLTFHRTKARDGGDLPIWITRPLAAAGQPGPAVVLAHGGPNLRSTFWEWNADAQFLASRGYLVIEPAYRGSRGCGAAHFRAGWKQWGLAMQDDITDALRYAVSNGWVDPKRVCIAGFRYGGYAALMGLVKDPQQYRCGIAGMALADPRFMFSMHWSDISESAREYSLPVLMGDPKRDEAQFIATSPLEQVARIAAPVLLMHGGKDRRVPIQNAERMHEALVKNGKAVEWLLYPDEGHGFVKPANSIDFWRHAENFLARHRSAGTK